MFPSWVLPFHLHISTQAWISPLTYMDPHTPAPQASWLQHHRKVTCLYCQRGKETWDWPMPILHYFCKFICIQTKGRGRSQKFPLTEWKDFVSSCRDTVATGNAKSCCWGEWKFLSLPSHPPESIYIWAKWQMMEIHTNHPHINKREAILGYRYYNRLTQATGLGHRFRQRMQQGKCLDITLLLTYQNRSFHVGHSQDVWSFTITITNSAFRWRTAKHITNEVSHTQCLQPNSLSQTSLKRGQWLCRRAGSF